MSLCVISKQNTTFVYAIGYICFTKSLYRVLVMDINKAKDYFHLGLLTSASIFSPSVMYSDGWTVDFKGNTEKTSGTLKTVRGEVRQFKTLDAAANALHDIGFRRFTVNDTRTRA